MGTPRTGCWESGCIKRVPRGVSSAQTREQKTRELRGMVSSAKLTERAQSPGRSFCRGGFFGSSPERGRHGRLRYLEAEGSGQGEARVTSLSQCFHLCRGDRGGRKTVSSTKHVRCRDPGIEPLGSPVGVGGSQATGDWGAMC